MKLKNRVKKLISLTLATLLVSGTIVSTNAIGKNIVVPTKSTYKHSSIIGKNRADTSDIIISNSKETNNYIMINQYNGLAYGLMNAANASKENSYILPVNSGSIPKELNYFNKSDKSQINLTIEGNSSSFNKNFINSLTKSYKSVKNDINNNLSKASVENLNENFSNATKIFVVNGYKGLADAMSIAPVSYRDKTPILFTNEDGTAIDGYAKQSGVEYVVIGGDNVIKESLVKELEASRLDGDTRYETNKEILDEYYPDSNTVYFTNGDTLVDAISSIHMAKDNGILLLNDKKNYTLLNNKNTYQIGGLPKANFSYKDENGKMANVTQIKAKDKVTPNYSTTKDKVYQHKIDLNKVMLGAAVQPWMLDETIGKFKKGIYVYNMKDESNFSGLSLLGTYLGDNNLMYYDLGDGVYEMDEDSIARAKKLLPAALEKENKYKKEIEKCLKSIDLNCSNYELINHVNKYICDNFSYKIINGSILDFTNNYEGQCLHYAYFFRNALLAAGVDCDCISSQKLDHVWNSVKLDGVTYYFDSTWNDGIDLNYRMWDTTSYDK